MNRISSLSRVKYAFASALVVGVAATIVNAVGCGSSSNTAAFVTDPYVYYSYYPADVSVASYYWADDWAYASLYALPSPNYGQPGVTPTAGTGGTATAGTSGTAPAGTSGTAPTPTTNAVITTVADTIRALARGETVCAGHVTVAAKVRTPVCTDGPTQSRSGVSIAFSACQTPGGGLIDGMVDVTSMRTATAAVCAGTTSITLSHTTTLTNLVYTAPSGIKVVIPSQTDTGSNTFAFGSIPPAVTFTTTGQLQTYAADGTLISDTSYTGTPTVSFGGSTAMYTVDGAFTTSNNLLSGAGVTYTLTGVSRVSTCCRPVAGTIQVSRNSGVLNTWTFGPACTDLTLDGVALTTLPACL